MFRSTIMHWQRFVKEKIDTISKVLQYIMQNSDLYFYSTKIQVIYSYQKTAGGYHQCRMKCFPSWNILLPNMPMSKIILHVGYQPVLQCEILLCNL
jgi:hypothetical protein